MSLDTKTTIRTQLLIRDAVPFSAKCVFYREPDLFLFLPLEDSETPKFREAVDGALKAGGAWLGTIALMNRQHEGQALIEFELAPGAREEAMERAKLRYRDNMIEAGVLTVGDAANC